MARKSIGLTINTHVFPWYVKGNFAETQDTEHILPLFSLANSKTLPDTPTTPDDCGTKLSLGTDLMSEILVKCASIGKG